MHKNNRATLFQKSGFKNRAGIIIGTGPSLNIGQVKQAQKKGAVLFGVNNTFNDFNLDVWIACDPLWHSVYSPVKGDFHKWHWEQSICDSFGYNHIKGKWGDGLSINPEYIHYGHSSGYQALNLAVHYGCDPILLVGYDMRYEGTARHYFENLSDQSGEYPEELRKYSTFTGLIKQYETIPKQKNLPKIYNATPNSGLTCFEFIDIENPLIYDCNG